MRPSNWVIVAVVVIGIGALAAIGWFYIVEPRMTTTVRADLLRLGDCVRTRESDVLPQEVKRVDCDGPHYGEVFAILRAPDAPEYPGEDALRRIGDQCSGKFFDYAPNIPEGPTFRLAIGYPSAQAWSEGARSVVCVAMAKNERWGSIRS
ncbi:septum formation family protein [Mycobacterium neumannii]|uniref:septum formation family protein n=1 Tax=Mycobacterium neumannii TaxID=2048551 RepID=UPI00192F4CE5|nr:septum formation family protein [Mycobacterium neumannii]